MSYCAAAAAAPMPKCQCWMQEMEELHHPLLGEEPTLQLLPDPVDVQGVARGPPLLACSC